LTVDFSSFFTWLKTTCVEEKTISRALFEALFEHDQVSYKNTKQLLFNPYEDDIEQEVLLELLERFKAEKIHYQVIFELLFMGCQEQFAQMLDLAIYEFMMLQKSITKDCAGHFYLLEIV